MAVSGNAVICAQQRHILIDNMAEGFDVYAMKCRTPVRRFYVPHQRRDFYSRGTMFGEAARTIMCGSDHDLIYIFDFESSIQLQTLCHDGGKFQRTVHQCMN